MVSIKKSLIDKPLHIHFFHTISILDWNFEMEFLGSGNTQVSFSVENNVNRSHRIASGIWFLIAFPQSLTSLYHAGHQKYLKLYATKY